MIQTFKIIHGFDDVKSETWFNIVGSGEHRLTRLTADPLNLRRLELRAIFLVRSLPGEVKTLEILKRLNTFTNDMLETLFE